MKKGECFYCQKKEKPSYKKEKELEKFLSERGRILGRSKTGLCRKHQRLLAREVKRARFLALLPFVVRAS